jgi:hypothetical protein
VYIRFWVVLLLVSVTLFGFQMRTTHAKDNPGQACADVLAHPPVPQIAFAEVPGMKVTPESKQSAADFNTLDPLAIKKACGDVRCARLVSVNLVADKVTQKTISVLVLCKSPDNQTVPLSYTPDELTVRH